MNDLDKLINEALDSMLEMIEVYRSGDDIDRELINKTHGG